MRYHDHSERKRRTLIRALVILAVLAVCFAGLLIGADQIERLLEPEKPEAVGSLEGRFLIDIPTIQVDGKTYAYRERALTNVLLIGVDWREQAEGRPSSRYDGQADFLMLLTADSETRQVHTLQIDRDTITPIRIYGPFGDYAGTRSTQLCLSHAYGESPKENAENVSWAVKRLMKGIDIDACLVLNMSGIAALNDALGGVTVTLEDDFSHLDPQMVQGATVTLAGQQAELFVRSRMNVSDGTNESRMRRQSLFIREAGNILKERISENIDFIDEVFGQLEGHMTLTADRTWYLDQIYRCRDYEQMETRSMEGTHRIGEDGFMEFWVAEEALEQQLLARFFQEAK